MEENKTTSVDVGVSKHTTNIQLELEMERLSEEDSFDYSVDIDDVGQIVVTPVSENTKFVKATVNNSSVTVTVENIKRFSISIVADMISDTENFNWFIGIDDIGQVVITPDNEKTSFLSASVEGSLNLVTESTNNSNLEVESEMKLNESDYFDSPENLGQGYTAPLFSTHLFETSFRSSIKQLDSNNEMVRDLAREDILTMKEEMDKQLEKFDEFNDYWNVRYKEVYRQYKRLQDMIPVDLRESLNESIDKKDIIDKFMKQEITILSGEGEPEEGLVHIEELDSTSGKTKYSFWYDEESGTLVCYTSKA